MEAGLRRAPWPQEADVQNAGSVRMDLLAAVGILCAVEPLQEFELSEAVVHAGGYWSVDQAVEHPMPGMEREWCKRNGGR